MLHDAPSHRDLLERVRSALLDGTFGREQRIDLQGLADQHRVSVTPVREVLWQLTGERLAEPFRFGGFQAAQLEARQLQDLYAWNGQHLLAALHLLSEPVLRTLVRPVAATLAGGTGQDTAAIFERLALAIGDATGNHEFVAQIASANDRLRRARAAEPMIFPDLHRELSSVVKIDGLNVKNNVRRRILAFHRRRVENAAQIAALSG